MLVTKEKSNKKNRRMPSPVGIMSGVLTRENLQGSSSGMLKKIINDALERAPNEQTFEFVLFPKGVVEQDQKLARLIEQTLKSAAETGQKNQQPIGHEFDPYAAGRAEVKRLAGAEGGAWTGNELSELFGLSSAVLHRRRKEHRIIFWRDPRGEFHYPKWQFNPAGALYPAIEQIVQTFRSNDEWRVMSYFLNPKRQLEGNRPIDLIRADQATEVIAHARRHAAENTW